MFFLLSEVSGMKKTVLLCLAGIVIFLIKFDSAFGQKKDGRLTGRILDEAGNEALFGAVVMVEGSGKGASADFEGNFALSLAEGSYTVTFKMLGYQVRQFKGVKINSGENTPLTVYLRQLARDVEEVEIVAEAARNNENALLKDQRAAGSIGSGVTAEMLTKTPDRNLSESFRRISGTSVREGKFAMVRGLSERYNMGQLNGVSISSTESDRKAFSLELFPSNLLDKIVVSKTATPDQPGDVAGGLIKIQTLDIPNSSSVQFTIAGEYNSLTTGKNFERIKASSTDVLGFDNGLRSIPEGAWTTEQADRNPDAQERARQSLAFNHQVSPQVYRAAPNLSGQFTLAKRGQIAGKTCGLIFSLNYYRNNLRNEFSSELPTINLGTNEIKENSFTRQDRYKTLTSLSSVLNLSMKPSAGSKISFRNFASQTGNNLSQFSVSEYRNIISPNLSEYIEKSSIVSFYEQNSLLSNQLSYEKFLDTEGGKLEVIAGTSYLYRNTPDYSRLNYDRSGNIDSSGVITERPQITTGVLPPVSFNQDYSGKFFSTMKEFSFSPSVQVSKAYRLLKIKHLAKAGVSLQSRNRNFNGRNYLYNRGSETGNLAFLPPDSIFAPGNFFPNAFTLWETTQKSDFYNASAFLKAGFLMNETFFGQHGSRLIYGLRYESYEQTIEATEIGKKNPGRNTSIISDLLPSFNAILNFNSAFGIRAAWSRTLNRPEFRELAGFTFFEPSQNVYFYGNPGLVRSSIQNFDLKGEWYPSAGSLLSLNLFYKKFTNPIEVTRGFVTTLPTFTYTNRDAASSYGWELEYRQRLSMLDSLLKTNIFSDFSVFGNFSWIRSEVVYNQTNFKRPIHGQSPYIINAGIQYQYEPLAMEIFLSYNRTGPRVAFLDDQNYAALIWEKPRDIIDLSIGKTLGKWNFKIIGGDLLGQDLIQYIVLDRGGRKADNKGLFGWISNTPNYQEGQDIPFFRFTNPRNLRFSINRTF
jgi:hypothetical protein